MPFYALKEDFSNYQSNIIVQNGNSEVAVKAAQALANLAKFLVRPCLMREVSQPTRAMRSK
jgi:hypothetical protein